jgi:hypothetical protein
MMAQCGMCRYNNCPYPFNCSCKCHQEEDQELMPAPNKIEQDYDQLVKQMKNKVEEATNALNAAYQLAQKAKIERLETFDPWYDLKDAARLFIDFEDNNGWTCSSW